MTRLIRAPMLPIARLRQVQRVRRTIRRREKQEHISMLAGLGRRARRLIRHDVLQAGQPNHSRRVRRRDLHAARDEVAHLAPLRVIPGGRVRVGDGDGVGHVGSRLGGYGAGPADLDGGLVLDLVYLHRVPELRAFPGWPFHVEEERREELVDDYPGLANGTNVYKWRCRRV